MGKCLTIVKLVGIGSLGIAGANYLYSAKALIPKILSLHDLTSTKAKNSITNLIVRARSLFWSFGSIASYLFYEAFKCSSPTGRHPYLVYAALIPPLGLLFNYYWVFGSEAKLLESCSGEPHVTYKKVKKMVKTKKPVESEKSPLDNSEYSDLGNPPEAEEETEVEEEVPVTEPAVILSASETKTELEKLKVGYFYTGMIATFGFALSAIGYWGDQY